MLWGRGQLAHLEPLDEVLGEELVLELLEADLLDVRLPVGGQSERQGQRDGEQDRLLEVLAVEDVEEALLAVPFVAVAAALCSALVGGALARARVPFSLGVEVLKAWSGERQTGATQLLRVVAWGSGVPCVSCAGANGSLWQCGRRGRWRPQWSTWLHCRWLQSRSLGSTPRLGFPLHMNLRMCETRVVSACRGGGTGRAPAAEHPPATVAVQTDAMYCSLWGLGRCRKKIAHLSAACSPPWLPRAAGEA